MVIVDTTSIPACDIYIWDLSSDTIRRVAICTSLWLWRIDADKNSLVMSQIDSKTDPPEVEQTKWNILTRVRVDTNHFHLPSGHRLREYFEEQYPDLPDECELYTFRHRTIRRLCWDDGQADGAMSTMDLIYDHSIDKLSIRWNDFITLTEEDTYTIHSVDPTPDIIYCWNPDSDRFEILNVYDYTMTIRPYQLHAEESILRDCFERHSFPGWIAFGMEPRFRLIGDHEVCGMESYDGIQFWFFNPGFTPDIPDAVPFP